MSNPNVTSTTLTIVIFLLFIVVAFIVLPIVVVWRDAYWRKRMDVVLTDMERLAEAMEEDAATVTGVAPFAAHHYNEFDHVIQIHRRSLDP